MSRNFRSIWRADRAAIMSTVVRETYQEKQPLEVRGKHENW